MGVVQDDGNQGEDERSSMACIKKEECFENTGLIDEHGRKGKYPQDGMIEA